MCSQPAQRRDVASVAAAPDQPLGWIGVAPHPANDATLDWLPNGEQSVIVPMPAEGPAAGAALSAIDGAGRTVRVTAAPPTKIAYGCDNGQLDVLPFTGDKLAPGAVWLLPPGAPAWWQPRALPVGTVSVSETQRLDTAGPLSFELRRSDASHGSFAIVRDGRVIHRAAIVHEGFEGEPPEPINFEHPNASVPVPAGAWSITDGGAIFLILRWQSNEGFHLTPFLIEGGHAREITALDTYLYHCAN